jgi:hypothetical protein
VEAALVRSVGERLDGAVVDVDECDAAVVERGDVGERLAAAKDVPRVDE